jgi:hypothetical protein
MILNIGLANGCPAAVMVNGANINLVQELTNRLNAFDVGTNAPAQAMFRAAEAGPTAATITINRGGGTHANGRAVDVDIDETIFDNGTAKADGLQEFAESTVFEIANANNAPTYDLLNNQVSNGQIGVIPYGVAMATAESNSTWTVSQVLQNSGAYVESTWGKKQIKETKVYASPQAKANDNAPRLNGNNMALGTFQTNFRAAPHLAGKTDQSGLPSAEYYAYEKIRLLGTVKAVSEYMVNVATVTHTKAGTATILAKKLSSYLATQPGGRQEVSGGAKSHVAWYILLIEFFEWLRPGRTPAVAVAWRNGTAVADWQFSGGMRSKAPTNGFIDKALTKAKSDYAKALDVVL